MNREIKFRFWDGHQFYKNPSFIGIQGEYEEIQTINDLLNHKTLISQQYTGLKDKNGIDVYDGDILKCKGYDGWFDKEGFYYNREVKHFISVSGESELSGFIYIPVDREVIGNIFQNPELLNNDEN
jgi:uncharacterized phage protein (TIGR01671 family)